MAVIWNVFILIHMFFTVIYDPRKKYRDYIPCAKDTDDVAKTKEIRCAYCGGVYYKGTVISCPHCGAPLTMDSDTQTNTAGWEQPKGF